MKGRGKTLLSVVLILQAGLPATASTVSLTDVYGRWMDTAGGEPLEVEYTSLVDSGYGNGRQDLVRWGSPGTSGGKSGLGFTGIASPHLSVEIGEPFEIGQLEHFNRPVGIDTACTNVNLLIGLQFESGSYYHTAKFNFCVNETLNEPGRPLSDDIITFPVSYPSSTVLIGETPYTLNLLGLGLDSSSLMSNVVTPEEQGNTTLLWGKLVQIPEPATLLLLAAGALMLRRRA